MVNLYFKKIMLLFFSYLPSSVKLGFYKVMGAKIGRNVYLGLGSYILPYNSGFDKIHVEEDTVLGDNVTLIARTVSIGMGSEIKDNTKISGESGFKMGDFSYIDQNVIINLRQDVEIGDETGVGANSSLYTHGVWLSALDGAPVKFGKIILQNRVWIAANVFVMPGVTVGDNAIIGACSVLTKDVTRNTVMAGNPAKEIRHFDPEIRPDIEEKNRIVLDMVKEFIERFEEKVKIMEEGADRVMFHVCFKKIFCGLFPRKEDSLVFYKKKITGSDLKQLDRLGKKGDNPIIISLLFDDEAKKICLENHMFWIDMGKRTASKGSSKTFSMLLKSFRNNGVRFDFLEECI